MPDPKPISPSERSALKQLVKTEYAQLRRELQLRSRQLQDEAAAAVRATHAERIKAGKAYDTKASRLREKFRTDTLELIRAATAEGFGHDGYENSHHWLSNPPRNFAPLGLESEVQAARDAVAVQAAAAEVALGRAEQQANRELIVGAISSTEASALLDRLVPKVEVLLPPLVRRAIRA